MKHVVALLLSGIVAAVVPIVPARTAAAVGASGSQRARLAIERVRGRGRMVVLHGFPALRADGRVVAAYAGHDFSAGSIVMIDVATGDELERVTVPERVVETETGDVEHTPDARGVRRVNAMLAQAGFVALPRLRVEENTRTNTGRTTRFAGSGLTVVGLTTMTEAETDATMVVTVRDARSQATLAERPMSAQQLNDVAVAPDRSFVVLEGQFCACECASSPSLARLAADGAH